jgi:hypothetical protein
MNKLIIKAFIISTTLLGGCNNESKKIKEKIQKKDEITNVISYIGRTIPIDGRFDSEEDYYNDAIQVVELKVVENDTINWCYDIQSPIKYEILGYVSNATIIYKNNWSENETIILKDSIIDGSYSITTKDIDVNSGTIIIKSGDKIIKKIVVNSE